VLTVTPGAVRIAVRVQPRGSRIRVIGRRGDRLGVQVTAPPVEGAANTAVIALIADWLNVPRGAVSIVHGHTGRDKLVEIATRDPAGLADRIGSALGCVDSANRAD
jgi:uncharacterized protein (TIGR00251 family)